MTDPMPKTPRPPETSKPLPSSAHERDGTCAVDTPDVPMYLWQGDQDKITINRKVSLYGSEPVCTLVAGDLSYSKPAAAYDVDLQSLANLLCDHLDSKRRGQ